MKPWTYKDVDFLRQNYHSPQSCAERLGRTKASIHDAARRFQIAKKIPRISHAQQKQAKHLVRTGYSTREAADEIGISYFGIMRYVRGLSKRKAGRPRDNVKLARYVFWCEQGLTRKQILEISGDQRKTVSKWLRRVKQHQLDYLAETAGKRRAS